MAGITGGGKRPAGGRAGRGSEPRLRTSPGNCKEGRILLPPLPLGDQDDDYNYCWTVVSGAIVVVSCIMLVVSATGAGVTSSAFF